MEGYVGQSFFKANHLANPCSSGLVFFGKRDDVREPTESSSDGANTEFAPLFDAASKGHTEVVELIVATGGFTEARNGEGFTPLQASVFDGNQTLRSSYFYTGPMLKQYITSKGLHFT